ncbi:MAG TPA: hypothetical protein PLO05_02695, partial [Bacteroidales bacterium]|nr:hypothetical protein [Bacteroidales bacterium]
MKTKHCFLIVLFVFSHLFSFSQYQYDNEYDVIPPAGGTKLVECSGSSDAYQNRYNVIANYIPESNTPSKVIKVNIVVMQDDSGGNNFQHDDPSDDNGHLYRVLQIFENLCIHKMDNMYPSDPISGVVDFSNPHFEFSLNNVYFYKSSIGNNSTSLSTLTNIIQNNNPESVHYVNNYNDLPSQLNEVNIFFTQATSGSSNANLPSDVYIDSPVRCVIQRAYTQGAWAVSGNIAHELGHNVDLCHTYLGGGCPTSISSMNSSENWFPDLFGDTYPGNAPHITSSCSPSWPDCPPITYPWDEDP